MTLSTLLPDAQKKKSKKWVLWTAVGFIGYVILCRELHFSSKAIIATGITKGPDHMF